MRAIRWARSGPSKKPQVHSGGRRKIPNVRIQRWFEEQKCIKAILRRQTLIRA